MAANTDGIYYNDHLNEDGAVVFAQALKLGGEGRVKRAESGYQSGCSKAWLMINNWLGPASQRVEEGTY